MSCDGYQVSVPLAWSSDHPDEPQSQDVWIKFVDHDNPAKDDRGCLCTFPHNDKEILYRDRLISLAQLGAAVVLAHHGHFKGEEDIELPYDLPQWIRCGIEESIKEQ